MAMLLNFALCYLSATVALRLEPGDVARITAEMQSTPTDITAQARGCGALKNVAMADPGEIGINGKTRNIAIHWLTEGYGEGVAQGMLNILATPAGKVAEEPLYQAATECFNAIISAQVQNDQELGLALYRNSPHLWDAFVGYFRRFKKNMGYQNDSQVVAEKFPLIKFAGLYGSFEGEEEVALGLDRAGGYDLILQIMEENPKNAVIVQAATGALSDNVQCSPSAAEAVVKHNGVNLLTNTVRNAYGMEHYHDEEGWGLRYEILEDIVGCMHHDVYDENWTTRDAFIEAGLMEAVIKIMPEEPNDLLFQDHCCQVFNFLTNGNRTLQRRLADSAAAALVEQAVNRGPCAPACKWPKPMQPYEAYDTGKTWGQLEVPYSCLFTLTNLEGGAGADWETWYAGQGPR